MSNYAMVMVPHYHWIVMGYLTKKKLHCWRLALISKSHQAPIHQTALFGHIHKHYLWRGINKAFDKRITSTTANHRGASLISWGCVSSRATANLVKMNFRMNAACYQKILEEMFHSSVWKLHMSCTWTFQHDNDPKHKAKSNCHWLQQNKMKVLEWVSLFNDFAVIEPLWGKLKLSAHARLPRNLLELEAFCKEEWSVLTSELWFCGIYHSRFQAVVDVKGGNGVRNWVMLTFHQGHLGCFCWVWDLI